MVGQDRAGTAPRPWHRIRLSPDVKPTHYHIYMYPNLYTGIFTGNVTISIVVNDVQNHIAVHAKGMSITRTRLTNSQDQEVPLRDAFAYEPSEFWITQPMEEIQGGSYKLYFEFSGSLTNKIVGIYRSVYREGNNDRYMIASKFEPTFARQAFPCFDEPAFKTPFDIEIAKPSGNEFIALSNMDQEEERENYPRGGYTTVKFATTKPMSTYLTCFVICDFEYAEGNLTIGNFPVNVFARRTQIENVHFAKQIGVKAANYYLEYFNVDYPLPKLDLIAIPDFVSGAMENWGLITFRETRLLCDQHHSSIATLLSIALTIAHEISHMWFGDLVTMEWWNDLWLNEGFATFIEYKAVDHIFPQWDLDSLFIVNELYTVLKMDSSLHSHPIISPVTNPDQITEIFDSISYNKGAAVLRMLENTIGPDAFKQGVHNYLQDFRLRNAKTDDLWEHLNRSSPVINVRSFMSTWTEQMGYPVLTVTFDKDNGTLTFSQKRFLLDAGATYDRSSSPFGYMWEIPITYITSVNSRVVETAWMRKTQESITIRLSEANRQMEWLKVNFHHHGYYIVNYELSMWEYFQELLCNSFRSLHPADRASLLADAFHLAEAELLPYKYALNLTEYLKEDMQYVPWCIASKEFNILKRRLFGTDAYNLFRAYVRSLINHMPVITWDVDDRVSYLQKSFQITILSLGCSVGHATCLNQALNLFRQWLSAPIMRLHPELVSIILNYGVEQTGEIEWERLWQLYLNEENPQDKHNMMIALCNTKEPSLIQRYLQLGKNEPYVRSQDYLTVVVTLSRNPTANPLVWDFVRNEWEYLVDRYTLHNRDLGRLIVEVSSPFSTEMRLVQMKEFFEEYPEAGAGENARRIALERVEYNINWRRKHVTAITDWLRRPGPPANG